MRPTMSEEFTIGYFMSQDIGAAHLDFGIRFDDITRDGSLAECIMMMIMKPWMKTIMRVK